MASGDDEEEDGDEYDDEDGDDEYLAEWQAETTATQLTHVKLNILACSATPDEYLALCLQTGEHRRYVSKLIALDRMSAAVKHARQHLRLVADANAIAQQLRTAGHLSEALQIGEHGLTLHGEKATLGHWLAPFAEAQNHPKQALAAWEAAFQDRPSLAGWQAIERLAGKGWPQRRTALMPQLQNTYDTQVYAAILLHEGDYAAAIQLADKHPHDYTMRAQVADAVLAHDPGWVIQTSLKEANQLIVKTQSKYYSYAAEWLRRMKAGYTQLEQPHDWQAYLRMLKEQYRRRPALMSYLNRRVKASELLQTIELTVVQMSVISEELCPTS